MEPVSRSANPRQEDLIAHRIRPGSKPGGPNLADPNRKVMVKHAAARRATRRLPLGEPLLVITTHAITSFRSSLPGPARDQPRAGAGSSPSRRAPHESRPMLCVMSRPTTQMYPPDPGQSTVNPENFEFALVSSSDAIRMSDFSRNPRGIHDSQFRIPDEDGFGNRVRLVRGSGVAAFPARPGPGRRTCRDRG